MIWTKSDEKVVLNNMSEQSRGVAWFSFKRGKGAEACPEPSIYDSFFIKWFTKYVNVKSAWKVQGAP